LCPNGDSLVLSIADWPVVLWDNGSANFSRVITAPGNYSAQVSTGYGHFLTLSITIAFAEIPSVITTVQNPSCFNFNDGYIQAQWSTDALTNSFQLSNLVAGNYNVPVAYGEGCSNMLPVELLNPEPLSVECAVTDVLCYGESSGSISFAMSGGTQPYNFGNSLVNGLFNLSANDYSGMLTDANGCEVFWNATINEPIPLSLSANTEMPSDLNMGGIFLNIIGGVQPYSFDWSNGIQTAENINLQAGDYTVVVTDNNGCVVDSSFSLIFNFVQPLKLNTMNWILQKDGLHYDGSETLHHVFVYDAVGRLLHREQIMAGHTTIPMNASGPVFILSHEGNWKSSISLE
jgi:hypothetical protein